ncbi:MAG: hypothetical protein HZA54_18930, partial [Planctomycetes bacterium]|nr:hypothetical protein [Planctomycetota bacterium]
EFAADADLARVLSAPGPASPLPAATPADARPPVDATPEPMPTPAFTPMPAALPTPAALPLLAAPTDNPHAAEFEETTDLSLPELERAEAATGHADDSGGIDDETAPRAPADGPAPFAPDSILLPNDQELVALQPALEEAGAEESDAADSPSSAALEPAGAEEADGPVDPVDGVAAAVVALEPQLEEPSSGIIDLSAVPDETRDDSSGASAPRAPQARKAAEPVAGLRRPVSDDETSTDLSALLGKGPETPPSPPSYEMEEVRGSAYFVSSRSGSDQRDKETPPELPVVKPIEGKTCTRCGCDNLPGSRFCSGCGQPMPLRG